MGETLAVYTTIYPGVEIYLRDWYRSLQAQTDQDFQLWIGLDQVECNSIQKLLGTDPKPNWVQAPLGSTPAQVRQLALSAIVGTAAEVVLVDSDDLLHPSRIAAARSALRSSDLAACALRFVDHQGGDLELVFDLPPGIQANEILPRNNAFGFSNTAFRSELLRQILPIPPGAVLVDWLLATRAWLLGARLSFDHEPRMDYRQHSANMALVRLPFSTKQVVSQTRLVRQHLQLVLEHPPQGYLPDRFFELKRVAKEIEGFHERVVLNTAKLESYVEAFNAAAPPLVWWAGVAYPALKHMWGE